MYKGLTISMLQSLTKENARKVTYWENRIGGHKDCIKYYKNEVLQAKSSHLAAFWERDLLRQVKWLQEDRRQLIKYSTLQKALKKEIAFRITNQQSFKRIQTEYDSTRKA